MAAAPRLPQPGLNRVLVADDDAIARFVLQETLTDWGYEVLLAEDGRAALDMLTSPDAPPLAAIDWMMPRMEGPEVCRRACANASAPFTYFMVLTSKTEKADVAAALDAGADDFLSKPIDVVELRSRLAVGLRIVSLQRRLAEQNAQLDQYSREMEQLAQARAQQLLHAERLSLLGTLSAGIAHDIANYLNIVSVNSEILRNFWETLEPELAGRLAGGAADSRAAFALAEMPKVLDGMAGGVDRTKRLLNGLKRFSRKDDEEATLFNVNDCVREAMQICKNRLLQSIRADLELAGSLPPVRGVPQQLEQVFVNLIINAADAMADADRRVLTVRTAAAEDGVAVEFLDTGTGLADEVAQRIWEPFFTTKCAQRGTGLGLSITRGIVQEMGGTVDAANRPDGRGARFTLWIPAYRPGGGAVSKA